MRKVVYTWRCNWCGSQSLYHEASTIWDVKKQDWVVEDVHNGQYCSECQDEVGAEHEPFDQICLWPTQYGKYD